MSQLAQQHPSVVFLKVDVDQAEDLSSRAGISSIPAIKFFLRGKEQTQLAMVGAHIEKLKASVNALEKL